MRSLVLALFLVLFAVSSADAQYTYEFITQNGGPGSTVSITSVLDTTGDPISGFQGGVCHDLDFMEYVETIALEAGDFDTTFGAITPQGLDGWTFGYLMNVITGATVDVGIPKAFIPRWPISQFPMWGLMMMAAPSRPQQSQ